MSITWSACADHLLVVLHDQHGVPDVGEVAERADQPPSLSRGVQPDGRLVETRRHAPTMPRADLCGEADPLGLATGERRSCGGSGSGSRARPTAGTRGARSPRARSASRCSCSSSLSLSPTRSTPIASSMSSRVKSLRLIRLGRTIRPMRRRSLEHRLGQLLSSMRRKTLSALTLSRLPMALGALLLGHEVLQELLHPRRLGALEPALQHRESRRPNACRTPPPALRVVP